MSSHHQEPKSTSNASKPLIPSTQSTIFTPVTLPSGATIPNRLIKVAMYEHLTLLLGGPPNLSHYHLYSLWANGGWGMIITGNVQVDARHLTLGRDMLLPKPDIRQQQNEEAVKADGKKDGKSSGANAKQEASGKAEKEPEEDESQYEEWVRHYQRLAAVMKGDFAGKKMNIAAITDVNTGAVGGTSVEEMERKRSKVIMQLNHSGRQSPFLLGGRMPFVRVLAPSAIGVGRGSAKRSRDGWFAEFANRIMFQTPREMTEADIDDVVERFTRGAKLAVETGFDGVQLHAAHGYLLAQFMSQKTNHRTDSYSASSENALHLLHRIVTSIRFVTPSNFILGVKISSSDYVEAGSGPALDDMSAMSAEEERAIGRVKEIAGWNMVDFIEITGGDYENPTFMASTARQTFFSRFARLARAAVHSLPTPAGSRPKPLIALTGGLHSLEILNSVLDEKHADLLGIGRGSVLTPDLPNRLSEHITFNSFINSSPSLVAKDLAAIFPAQPNLTSPPTTSYSFLNTLIHILTYFLTSLGILPLPQLIGAGLGMAWYTVQMSRLSMQHSQHPSQRGVDWRLGAWGAIFEMWGVSFGIEDGWMIGVAVGIGIGLVVTLILEMYVWGPRRVIWLAKKAAKAAAASASASARATAT